MPDRTAAELRAALRACAAEGLTSKEAAARLGETHGRVKGHYNRDGLGAVAQAARDEAQATRLRALLATGLRGSALAAAMGVNRSRIHKFGRRLGVHVPHAPASSAPTRVGAARRGATRAYADARPGPLRGRDLDEGVRLAAAEGLGLAETARTLRVSNASVLRVLDRTGLGALPVERLRERDARVARLQAHHDAGLTVTEAARREGVDVATLRRNMRETGVNPWRAGGYVVSRARSKAAALAGSRAAWERRARTAFAVTHAGRSARREARIGRLMAIIAAQDMAAHRALAPRSIAA